MSALSFLDPIQALPAPYDRDATSRGLESFFESARNSPELAGLAETLSKETTGKALLEAVFGNSPFLSHCIIRDPGFFLNLVRRPPQETFEQLIAGLNGFEPEQDGHPDATMQLLRKTKVRAATLIALTDIANLWDVDTVTKAISSVAEAAVSRAVNVLLHDLARRGDLGLPDLANPSFASGYIVLAMGKLGSRELNFSSDIDLIVLFDPDVSQYTGSKSVQDAFVRMTQRLVHLLQERTADGYVFRTDLRLRPDAGATPLALSVRAAETYYESVGQNWERAAMIKARPIGGDLEAGEAFLEAIRPFVWRKHLDYAAIADIHSIKRQIDSNRGYTKLRVAGHNIKLGHGGIREIEFFAQTQQLIAGGRDPTLRVTATCDALSALEETHRIDAETANDLKEAYRFLRRLEHRLQMIADEQTQTLPDDDAGLEHIATFLGFADRKAFEDELLSHMRLVRDRYGALFEDAPALGSESGNLVFTGTDDDPDTLETLTEMGFREAKTISAMFRRWHHGRYRATRSTRSRELLTDLAPHLLSAFARTANPDAALLRFDEFLGKLPAGIQLFSLFYSNPSLLDLMAEIVGSAPRLAEFLSRDPLVLDSVLSEGFLDPLPEASELEAEAFEHVQRARDFQDSLDLARRWTRDRRLQAGVQVLRNLLPGHQAGPVLSNIADAVLNALIPAVEEDFARRHGRVSGATLALVALGKLGSREMMFGSDLDLIFVYDGGSDQPNSDGPKPLAVSQYFARLGQQIISAITSLTPEGRLYEIDMRLRPSGTSGPLAINVEGFEKYQRAEAWTWERMALTRARVVHATPALKVRLHELITELLVEPRPRESLAKDVAEMRARIEKEFPATDPWQIKYVRGGLMDAEFIAQYLKLAHGGNEPDLMSLPTAATFKGFATSGQIPSEMAAELATATNLLQDVEALFRLCIEGAPRDETIPPGLTRALTQVSNMPDLTTLKTEVARQQQIVAKHYDRLIGEPGGAPIGKAVWN